MEEHKKRFRTWIKNKIKKSLPDYYNGNNGTIWFAEDHYWYLEVTKQKGLVYYKYWKDHFCELYSIKNDLFFEDIIKEIVEEILSIKINIIGNDGYQFLNKISDIT